MATTRKQIINGKQVCGHCKNLLPLSEFGIDSRTCSGLRGTCKYCSNKAVKKSRPNKYTTNVGIIGLFSFNCPQCKKDFTTRNPNKVFCSPKCRKRDWYLKNEKWV